MGNARVKGNMTDGRGKDGDTALSFNNLSRMAREPEQEQRTYREDVCQK